MNRDSFSAQMPMSTDEIGKSITGALPAVDQARAKGLAQLGTMRDAKARSLAREQTLLARKHGGVDHPRIGIAQQKFTTNEGFRREIAVMNEAAETPLPEPDANTLVVHGFVRRRRDHAGLPGLTLALTDEEGNWLRELGYACTDQRGYFRLDARGRDGETPQDAAGDLKAGAEMNVESAKREAEAKAAAREAGQAGSAAGTSARQAYQSATGKRLLRLRVYDSKGHVLHTEPRGVLVRGGRVDYRYILLGDAEADCACTPPPAKAGGRPATTGPKAPTDAPAQAPRVPPQGTAAPAPTRVSTLKSFQQPTKEELAKRSMAVEAIRGIGPKTGEKLRQAGIDDVGEFSSTRGSKLAEIAGFDKTPPKSKAEAKAASAAEKMRTADKPAGEKAAAEPTHKAAAKKAPRKKG